MQAERANTNSLSLDPPVECSHSGGTGGRLLLAWDTGGYDQKPQARPVRELALEQSRFTRVQSTYPVRGEHFLTQMQQDTDER